MTNDQEAALQFLEMAIMSPRKKGRIKAIRKEFLDYRKTLYKSPWYKRLLKPRPS